MNHPYIDSEYRNWLIQHKMGGWIARRLGRTLYASSLQGLHTQIDQIIEDEKFSYDCWMNNGLDH